MPRADELRALQARVEAFEVGNSELDEAIHAALLPDDHWWRSIVEGRRLVAAGDPEAYVICPPTGPLGGENRMRAATWAKGARVRSYTTSLDDAVALVSKMLPGWSWEVRRSGYGHVAQASLWDPRVAQLPGTVSLRDHASGVPALALIAALLSALISREGGDGR